MRDDEWAQIASFAEHPTLALLGRALEEKAEVYYANLAHTLRVSSRPVDQREIDYKRGFGKGAIHAVSVFPRVERHRWLESAEKAMKETSEEWLTRH
jgi:hypothetical protein